MPDMYPTFQIAAFIRSASDPSGIFPAGKTAEQYACDVSSRYGYYDDTRWFTMSPRWYPTDSTLSGEGVPSSAWSEAGPRSVICTKDLGATNQVTVYVKQDMIGRTISGPQPASGTVPCWGAEDGFWEKRFRVTIYDPKGGFSYLYSRGNDFPQFAASFDRVYGETLIDDSVLSPAEAQDEALITPVVVSALVPETEGMAIWLDDPGRNSNQFRNHIVGIKVNGILYGQDENGFRQDDYTFEEQDGAEGPFFWRDLRRTVQTAAGQGVLISQPFTEGYDEGYNVVGPEKQLLAHDFGAGAWLEIDYLRYERSAYGWGVWRGALDYGTSQGYDPNAESHADFYAREFGPADGIYAAFASGSYPLLDGSQVPAYALGFTDPATYSDGEAWGLAMVEYYLGSYAGYVDGFADGYVGDPFDAGTGQTGGAQYNSGYAFGYGVGHDEGGNAAGLSGGGDPPEGDPPP